MLKLLYLRMFVDNQVGVLDRISVLIRRSGWNVKDINACEEPWLDGSRIALTIEGRADKRLLLNQLERLDCIRELRHSEETDANGRELALFQVPASQRKAADELASRFGAILLRESDEAVTYQLCADGQTVDTYLGEGQSLAGVKAIRTGVVDL